jgi:hypothetical protein
MSRAEDEDRFAGHTLVFLPRWRGDGLGNSIPLEAQDWIGVALCAVYADSANEPINTSTRPGKSFARLSGT